MRSIADTIARLSPRPFQTAEDPLTDLDAPFDNPGALRARVYVPEGLVPGAALVVVLHGCTQTAAGYDHGSGWSTLADAHGFALLYAEQVRANNPNLCLNWFLPGDTTRGGGEVASIAAMIGATARLHRLDPARVFVTGLSAGGAMTAAMLATYPELFAGGAIIAGLPHGTARSVPEALERMRGRNLPDSAALVDRVRRAAPAGMRWPSVAVWHGSADATVAPAAGEAVVAQWLGVHRLTGAPTVDDIDGHARRIWRNADGRVLVEAHVVSGMGHGTPIDSAAYGTAGAFMLDVGSSSTLRIAQSWGIVPPSTSVARARPRERPATSGGGIASVIENALRAAGLV